MNKHENTAKLPSTKEMLIKARREGYAVPAFNIHNMETLQVVVDTAAKLKSPVILAATPGTVQYMGMQMLHDMALSAARTHGIPIALHLDHATDLDMLIQCVDTGFGSVMIDGSHLDFEENIKVTQLAVAHAHAKGATVEAELGRLGGREEHVEVAEAEAFYTDPEAAVTFVAQTGIDSLAVAIGTAHGLYKSEPKLDTERLSDIAERLTLPLVLHGASGVPEHTVRLCIEKGISKVNIATELKIAFASGLKATLAQKPEADDPRVYFKEARQAMAEVVSTKIKMCGSNNRAE